MLLPELPNAMINFFGDSITVGTGAKIAFPNIIAALLHVNIYNYAVGGTQIADQVSSIYKAYPADSIFLTGFNDARFYGSITNDYQSILYAMVAYLGCKNKWKFNPSGNWKSSTLYKGFSTVESYEPGDSLSFEFKGSILYLAYTKFAEKYTGSFEVLIDNISFGIYYCNGMLNPFSKIGYEPALIRISGLSNENHKVTINHIDKGLVSLQWYSTPTNNVVNKVILGETLHMDNTGYAIGFPFWNHSSNAVVKIYNAIINEIANRFHDDGLNVKVAKMNYDPITKNSDHVHPNDDGQETIAKDFLRVINNEI